MEKRGDAPKIVNIGVWTVAVTSAFVFALTIGIGLYNTVNNPISASEVAPTKSCKSGEALLAFNNYPNTYFKTIDPSTNKIYEHKPFEDAMDGHWRCSKYCVPIPADANTATNDAKTQEALAKYLTGATTDGKPVIIATETEFVGLLKSAPANLKNTVILTSTKTTCQGYYNGAESKGASYDYKNLVLKIDDKDVAVSPVTTNNTVQEQQAKVEQQKQYEAASAAELQAATEAGSQSSLKSVSRRGSSATQKRTVGARVLGVSEETYRQAAEQGAAWAEAMGPGSVPAKVARAGLTAGKSGSDLATTGDRARAWGAGYMAKQRVTRKPGESIAAWSNRANATARQTQADRLSQLGESRRAVREWQEKFIKDHPYLYGR